MAANQQPTTGSVATTATTVTDEDVFGPFEPISDADRARYNSEFRTMFPELATILESARPAA